jgi:hypothetical protein
MLRFMRLSLVVVSACLLALSMTFTTRTSDAQPVATATATTTTTALSGPTVSQSSGQVNPNRLVNGKNLGQSTRPQNLTPTGISYSDCASDMVLQFPVIISGFDGSSLLEVWAGTSDCSQDANRGLAGELAPVGCWQVTQPIGGLVANGVSTGENISVRVQDIVSHISTTPTTAAYVQNGISACSAQTVDTATTLSIYFVPTSTAGTVDGNVFNYTPLVVDLVGPEAPPVPASARAGAGDTLIIANWTPNTDPDTIGYDVFIDPIPGQEGAVLSGGEPVLVCRDSGAAASASDATVAGDGAIPDGAIGDASGDDAVTTGPIADGAAASDSGDDADLDANASTQATDASQCVYESKAVIDPTGAPGQCASTVLTNANSTVISVTGVATTTTDAEVVDDAALGDDAATSALDTDGGTSFINVGISHIDPKYIYKPDSITGITAASITASSYTITGLQDGVNYNIAIAAVDALGNVGPLSPLQCNEPEPIVDFWQSYRQAGGQAGGGFCALEAAGAPAGSAVFFGGFVSLAAAAWRRRRGKRR